MLKLIVFDWDGTLADSLDKIVACKSAIAHKYGLPIPSSHSIRELIGIKFEKALIKTFPTASKQLLNQIADEFQLLMQQDQYQANLFPHALEVLQVLKKRQLVLTIATSKSRVELNKALLYNELTELFETTCCSEEYCAKPSPAMLTYLMDLHRVEPNECLVVGDTTIDIEFALNAGVNIINVTYGAHSTERLHNLGSLALIDDLMHLPNAIDKFYR